MQKQWEVNCLESATIRQNILARLNEQINFSALPAEQKYTEFVKDRLIVDHQTCVEIEKKYQCTE